MVTVHFPPPNFACPGANAPRRALLFLATQSREALFFCLFSDARCATPQKGGGIRL